MSDLDDLRAELEDFAQPEKKGGRPPREERIIAGFEDIQRFVEEHKRLPEHGEDRDIFERLYAVRLDRLRQLDECNTLLAPLDHQGILTDSGWQSTAQRTALNDDALLAELAPATNDGADLRALQHVRSTREKQEAEEVAQRNRCPDFDTFKPLFEQVQRDLKSGVRTTRPFLNNAGIEAGHFFVLGGQTVYVAEVGESFRAPNGDTDARLRVIYSNGTESNLLLRSLQRALYKDEAGRRITEPNAGPLFGETLEEEDQESGTIYVLRSLSSHPFVQEHRELIHKIGVTGGKVETRLANATHDATYLLADVEVVATYKLAGINRVKMEALFHKIFAPAQLDLVIQDRFGNPVKPREWFLVPLHVIDEAVTHIRSGHIASLTYDPETASLRGD